MVCQDVHVYYVHSGSLRIELLERARMQITKMRAQSLYIYIYIFSSLHYSLCLHCVIYKVNLLNYMIVLP